MVPTREVSSSLVDKGLGEGIAMGGAGFSNVIGLATDFLPAPFDLPDLRGPVGVSELAESFGRGCSNVRN